jgi:hypothetical protein
MTVEPFTKRGDIVNLFLLLLGTNLEWGRVCSFRGRATRSAPQLENLVIRHSIGAPFSQLAKHLDNTQ